MHLDALPQEDDIFEEAKVVIARIDEDENGSFTQKEVKTAYFGPPDEEHRETFKEKLTVDWKDSGNRHVINIYSNEESAPLSFTLAATRQSPLSRHSVLIAALIMVFVYIFILLEFIHRTLVSIFGSMIALFFLFLMHDGETESIRVSQSAANCFMHLNIQITYKRLTGLCRQSCFIKNGAP